MTAEVGLEAARRAVAKLGARKIPTGLYPVVFDKDAARAIVGLVAGCVLGDAVYRHRSYLGDRLGERIGSKLVTLIDDPALVRGPGSRPFDGEGRAVRKIVVARGGVLRSFLLDGYSARKLGLKPTGSAAGGGGIPHSSTSNFYLAAGRSRPESLPKGIERGLFVTRMMGFGFDPTTGNFSRGAEGFLIENGELGIRWGNPNLAQPRRHARGDRQGRGRPRAQDVDRVAELSCRRDDRRGLVSSAQASRRSHASASGAIRRRTSGWRAAVAVTTPRWCVTRARR